VRDEGRLWVPIVPMNWTLMPVCSSRLPSFGLIVTAPFTDSPSIYRGAFSRRFFSNFMSIICLSSVSSSRSMSISTGVEKKYDMMANGDCRVVRKKKFHSTSITTITSVVDLDSHHSGIEARVSPMSWHLPSPPSPCTLDQPPPYLNTPTLQDALLVRPMGLEI